MKEFIKLEDVTKNQIELICNKLDALAGFYEDRYLNELVTDGLSLPILLTLTRSCGFVKVKDMSVVGNFSSTKDYLLKVEDVYSKDKKFLARYKITRTSDHILSGSGNICLRPDGTTYDPFIATRIK